jgi:hypothetical protein
MIHIQRFVERLQGSEARGQRDFQMSVKEAKDLHADITKLLLIMEALREQANKSTDDQVISVNVEGGPF